MYIPVAQTLHVETQQHQSQWFDSQGMHELINCMPWSINENVQHGSTGYINCKLLTTYLASMGIFKELSINVFKIKLT